MLDAAAEHGPGIKAPTPYEIGHVCVEKEYEELQAWVQTFKWAWKERGCTVMCDGWTTITHCHLLNFLVYSSMGTVFMKSVDATDYIQDAKYINKLLNEVIEEIGADCVVQAVTDNAANMKAAGMMLMKQRPRIFWSPCAAHCLDLMLEDIAKGKVMQQVIGKIKKITNFFYQSYRLISMMKTYTDNHELLRPGITRFATHFIAIESVYKYREGLLRLIKSHEFINSKWGKRPSPITLEVCKIIESNKFWPHVKGVLNVFDPLIKVLRLVDGDDKPTMGFLHEAMERSKLAIQADCKYYKKFWKIIDDRWGRQLKHDLHTAGYFFNPQFTDGHISDEIRLGLKNVIERLAASTDDAIWATNQIDIYNVRAGSFGTTTARRAIAQTYPAEWWLNYGESAPALRTIAIKVLSQTTSSSNCERNWSTFSFIHTRPRNRLTMQKLNKLVYIHYNLKLRSRNRRRRQFEDHREYFCPINLDYIFSEEDTVLGQWLEEQEEPVLDQDPEFEELMEELTGDRPEPVRAAERIQEINLTMQQGRAPDTSEPRGKEVDEESESSISTSSSSAGIPPDSPGDEGHYRDDEHITYETVEHFPDATELDPRRGYVRHVGQTGAGGSSSAATHGHHGSYVGQGAMYGQHGGYVGQQGAMYGQHGGYVGQQGAMYGQHGGYSYDPNWVPPSPTPLISIEHMLIEQGRLTPPISQRPLHAPHHYFMPYDYNQSSQSTGDQDSSSSYQEQSEYGYGYGSAAQQYGAYHFSQYRRNDDDDIEPGRHSTWN
ncbi:hypothetical protein CKAN_00150000 [Cinnamomum micranthum f. kanehirae]|uniref:DUF659 domain-containing protein n=1 Tax=Cinnamomum micranthum f. kanehirae TaxID=337451 RepID=A0A3S3PUT8_9MAGN|nr:hypothetical protein CKAN_00150000 [Cinnamomum micranthum f. kanehirae]